MRLREELGEPWGLLAGGLAGGLAWATGIAPVLAVGVGGAVYGAKILAGLAVRGSPQPETGRVLPVRPDSDEEGWLRRARAAERAFGDVAASGPPGPIAERVRGFGRQTADALASIRRLAGQASAVGQAMARVDVRRLEAEQARLASAAGQAEGRVRQEQERSLAAVRGQLDTYARLAAARATLLARLESGALGLEGLVARLAEVVALAETTVTVDDGVSEVDSLAAELDGLRAGLVEAEDLSSRALGGVTGLDLPGTGSVGAPDAKGGRPRRSGSR